jgi:2-oxoglutarate ferredoxin oxidoreductase subunit alpha
MTGRGVLTGVHFMHGDHACAEGAIAAGCRFFAGYPITPSTEIAERMAQRLPEVGGVFIQMEDEIASIMAVLGASAAGARAMTATSGPGFSLMMESVGLAAMLEIPCVIVDVQRGSPSTGLPTLPGQADVMQARWGSHGDYEIAAYAPWSPQEMFDLTVLAFNVADRFRIPVMVMADEVVGHMVERVVIPPEDQIPRWERKRPRYPAGNGFKPFLVEDEDLVPPMVHAGEGYRVHFTGLTHDERGYPDMSAETHHRLVTRLVEKVRRNAHQMIRYDTYALEDAEDRGHLLRVHRPFGPAGGGGRPPHGDPRRAVAADLPLAFPGRGGAGAGEAGGGLHRGGDEPGSDDLRGRTLRLPAREGGFSTPAGR